MKTLSASTLSIFALLALGVLVVGAVLFLAVMRPPSVQMVIASVAPTATFTRTPTPEPIQVYITGEVGRPNQVYQLPFGSRIADLVAAAGGATVNADLPTINLAAFLTDGQQIHIPAKPTATYTPAPATPTPLGMIAPTNTPPTIAPTLANVPAGPTPVPTATTPVIVRINFATEQELDALPGIGPAIAHEIAVYRANNGYFTTHESLLNVPGIGPAKLEAIRDLIRFD